MVREILSFLSHRIASRSWKKFHSPYLFRLFKEIVSNDHAETDYLRIEEKRKQLLRSKDNIQQTDLGAGSKKNSLSVRRQISAIARSSLSQPYQCRFMAGLVRAHSAQTILELGTSLGISAAYMAVARKDATLLTVEGDPAIAAYAGRLFRDLHINNIHLINKSFEAVFRDDDLSGKTFDLIFIDGNHRKRPLLQYFHSLLPHAHEKTIFVIDDIYWSQEMKEAWLEIVNMPVVTQSVDCYLFGLVFINKDFLQREHHKIRLPLSALLH